MKRQRTQSKATTTLPNMCYFYARRVMLSGCKVFVPERYNEAR